MIITRTQVQAAVSRALQLDPHRDRDAAIEAAARALGVSVEIVEEALRPVDEEQAA